MELQWSIAEATLDAFWSDHRLTVIWYFITGIFPLQLIGANSVVKKHANKVISPYDHSFMTTPAIPAIKMYNDLQ